MPAWAIFLLSLALSAPAAVTIVRGRERTRNLYATLIGAGFVAVPVTLLATDSSAWGVLMLLSAPLVDRPLRAVMTRTDGPALNGALAGTGALLAAFSALLALGLLLATI